MFEIIFFIILALFAVGGIWAYVVTKKAKKNGIETDAVVIRVRLHRWRGDNGGTMNRDSFTEEYDITYTDQAENTVEAMLTNTGKHTFKEGDQVRIRYLPDRTDYPVLVDGQ